jgi:hypothetical protein
MRAPGWLRATCALVFTCIPLSACSSGTRKAEQRTTTTDAATGIYCARARALVNVWSETKREDSSWHGLVAGSAKMAAAYRGLADVSPADLRDATADLVRVWEYTLAGLQRLPPARSKQELGSDLNKVVAAFHAKYGSSAVAADVVSAYMKTTCGLELDNRERAETGEEGPGEQGP